MADFSRFAFTLSLFDGKTSLPSFISLSSLMPEGLYLTNSLKEFKTRKLQLGFQNFRLQLKEAATAACIQINFCGKQHFPLELQTLYRPEFSQALIGLPLRSWIQTQLS